MYVVISDAWHPIASRNCLGSPDRFSDQRTPPSFRTLAACVRGMYCMPLSCADHTPYNTYGYGYSIHSYYVLVFSALVLPAMSTRDTIATTRAINKEQIAFALLCFAFLLSLRAYQLFLPVLAASSCPLLHIPLPCAASRLQKGTSPR